MATIKSFSDFEQSKKLVEILPLKSADMYYPHLGEGKYGETPRVGNASEMYSSKPDIPCWSLAVLLNIIPILDNRSPVLSKTFDRKYRVIYHSTAYEKAILTSDYDNPVDACYKIILELKEKNLL